VSVVLAPDSSRRETALRFPAFLPDGRRFLFVSLPLRDGEFDVQMGEVGSPTRRLIFRAGASPVYVAPGYLVTIHGPRLTAERFDARTGKVVGKPITLGPAPVGALHEAAPGHRLRTRSPRVFILDDREHERPLGRPHGSRHGRALPAAGELELPPRLAGWTVAAPREGGVASRARLLER